MTAVTARAQTPLHITYSENKSAYAVYGIFPPDWQYSKNTHFVVHKREPRDLGVANLEEGCMCVCVCDESVGGGEECQAALC